MEVNIKMTLGTTIQKVNKNIEFFFNWLSENILTLSSIALVVLTGTIFLDVFFRAFIGRAIHGAAEATEIIMPYITFLPLAYALKDDRHVRITFVSEHNALRNYNKIFDFLMYFFGLLFCSIVAIYSQEFFWKSFIIREQRLAMVKIPLYIGKLGYALGYLVFAIGYFERFLKLFSNNKA